MDDSLGAILSHWPQADQRATAARIDSPRSFSGAGVWRIDAGDAAWALRRWPPGMTRARLAWIHGFQLRLARAGIAVVPAPVAARCGDTFVEAGESLWELADWRPGAADFRTHPTSARLTAAMQILARIHNASPTTRPSTGEQLARRLAACGHEGGVTPLAAVEHRARRLGALAGDELDAVAAHLAGMFAEPARDLALNALALVRSLAPRMLADADRWRTADLPAVDRLQDIHGDHVLFTGDAVTGVVDFGAADHDSPAGDVARLLGSLVGDDEARRRAGLDAYTSVRPLSRDELAAVDFFDGSGTVIAAANWLAWLWGHPERRLAQIDGSAAQERLAELAARLRRLAERRS